MTVIQRIRRRLSSWRDQYLCEVLLGDHLIPFIAGLLYPRRRCKPPIPDEVRSVLVWNIDSIGDLLWTTPTLRALRRGYPSAKITMICNAIGKELVDTNPNIDELIPIDPKPFYLASGLWKRVRQLAGRHFDVMVVLEMGTRPGERGRLLGRQLNVRYLVSTDLGQLKLLSDHSLPPNQSADTPKYWPEYMLDAAAHLGLQTDEPRLEVFRTTDDRARVDELLRDIVGGDTNLPVVVFHPLVAPYARLTKQWPAENFVELARLLLARKPMRILLTGSADERSECESLAERMRMETRCATIHSLAGKLAPREAVELFSRSSLVVTADTAALHMSVAAGAPTIGLFGATDHRMIAPPGPRCVALTEGLPCSPCLRYRDKRLVWPTCIFARQECMYTLSPGRVANEAQTILHRTTAQ